MLTHSLARQNVVTCRICGAITGSARCHRHCSSCCSPARGCCPDFGHCMNRRVAWKSGQRLREDIQFHFVSFSLCWENPGKMLERCRKRSGFSHGTAGAPPHSQAGREAFLWSPPLSLIAFCLSLSLSLSTTNQIRTTGDGVSDLLAAAAAAAVAAAAEKREMSP